MFRNKKPASKKKGSRGTKHKNTWERLAQKFTTAFQESVTVAMLRSIADGLRSLEECAFRLVTKLYQLIKIDTNAKQLKRALSDSRSAFIQSAQSLLAA